MKPFSSNYICLCYSRLQPFLTTNHLSCDNYSRKWSQAVFCRNFRINQWSRYWQAGPVTLTIFIVKRPLSYIHWHKRLTSICDNKVSTVASTDGRSPKGTTQPTQAALKSYHDSKAHPMMTTPLQWIKMMPNISVWKYQRIYVTSENMPYVYQCSLYRF